MYEFGECILLIVFDDFFILDRHKFYRLENKFEVLIVSLQIVPIQTYVKALTIPHSPIPQDV